MLADRRITAPRLVTLLGAWRREGAAYEALADALRASVLSGAVPLRTTLPGERELADALDVSRTTTASAYDVLRSEGYLVSRRGSGTFTTLPGGPSTRRKPDMQAPDDGVLDLSIAAPPAPTRLHAAYLDALDALPRHLASTGYAPLGLAELREAVAERYSRRGTPTTPDQVLVTSGAQHALHLLLAVHCGPGDRVAVEHPTYPGAIGAVRGAGARPVPVPVHGDGLDVDLLESTVRQVSPRVAYVIPDNQNPTGTSLSEPARDRVRALARRTRTLVVGDEALTDLLLDGPAPQPLAGDGRSSLVVSIGSASKSYWGGLRVGWVRADADLVARLAAERSRVDLGTPVLEQLVTARLLVDGEALLDDRRAYLRERRDLLLALLAARLPEWHVAVPPGGLSVWVDLGAPVSSALVALCARLGLRLAAGPAFGVDGSFERFLRLPFTAPGDALERAVTVLADAWVAVGVPTRSPAEPPPAFAAVV